MLSLKIHQQKVYDCLQFVNKEAGKIRNVKQAVRAKMIDFIIADACEKYWLKFTNVKIIYYGKTKI